MPYITIPVRQKEYQISFDDILNGINESFFARMMDDTCDTRTVYRDHTPPRLLEKINIGAMVGMLEKFNNRHREYFDVPKENLYETFYLMKKNKGFSVVAREIFKTHNINSGISYSGKDVYADVFAILKGLLTNHPCSEHNRIEQESLAKCVQYLTPLGFEVNEEKIKSFIKAGFRRIDAPRAEFKSVLTDLKITFENKLFGSYHTSAFAYVKGRSTIDALKRHQRNNSRWFLKLDFSNFFGSTTHEFVLRQLSNIFPYSEIVKSERGREALSKALSLCFLNGVLPQGTPFSPTITNIMMIPIDHAIAKMCREHSPHLCYTRYADDILISSDLSFTWEVGKAGSVQDEILDILRRFNVPFSLNTEKTRYGSSAGRNWNLGLMLNKDNEITIGHEKRKAFKAAVYSFLNDYTHHRVWDVEEVQVLGGQIAYYRNVEKENIDAIILAYNQRFGVDMMQIIKDIISNR